MRSLIMALCAAAAACTAGCGGGYEIADGPLSGKIAGADWTFVTGWTDDFLSDEEGFFTSLYDIETEACGVSPDTDWLLLLDVPTEPGEYELSFSQNVTFAWGDNNNNIATIGRMVVERVTDEEVDVGLYAIFGSDPDFEVSGHFTASVCPSTP
jgi:hypothetical protein